MLAILFFWIFHGINIFMLVGKAATGFVTKVQTRVFITHHFWWIFNVDCRDL
jgi:hypothetical protein